jgi:hypothetical protein
MNKIIDSNGYTWKWDGKRIFCVEAEIEMISDGMSKAEVRKENGYPASSWEKALEQLEDGGYLETMEGEK